MNFYDALVRKKIKNTVPQLCNAQAKYNGLTFCHLYGYVIDEETYSDAGFAMLTGWVYFLNLDIQPAAGYDHVFSIHATKIEILVHQK